MSDVVSNAIYKWIRDVLPYEAQASLTPNIVKPLHADLMAQLAAAVAAEREACADTDATQRQEISRLRDEVEFLVKERAAAVAAEREACAVVAQEFYRRSSYNSRVRSLGQDASDNIAAAIRARGTT